MPRTTCDKPLEFRRRRVPLAATLSLPLAAHADWAQIEKEACGQTVYFNAWGGSEVTNAYIAWAAKAVQSRYGVTLKHVKVSNAANRVKRVQTELAAGRTQGGSIDLMWVNGENFRKLKDSGLLLGPWAEFMPNWDLINLNKPVRSDFSVPTNGYEVPWGTAQLTFIANQAATPHASRFAASGDPSRLCQRDTCVVVVSGRFAANAVAMHRMLADGELKLSLAFNPNEAANLIKSHQLPASAYSFGFTRAPSATCTFWQHRSTPTPALARRWWQNLSNIGCSCISPVRQPASSQNQSDGALCGGKEGVRAAGG